MNQNYREAVKFATEFLSKQFRDGKLSTHRVEPTEFLYVFGLQIVQHFDDHPWCGSHYSYPKHAFPHLFQQSGTDKGAFDIASRITTSKLLRDEPMSLDERLFAAQVIGGMRKSPQPEGKRRTEHFALNIHLVILAKVLVVKFGLKLTRNAAAVSQDSACDAVSQALSLLGPGKSWRAITELLTHKSSERVREVADAVRSCISQSRQPRG